jgi:bifunctional non-homologous end joining protein LigD
MATRTKQHLQAGGREITVSNLDKVFYPESGFTKGEVIRYYTGIAEFILPHLRARPLTLKRYPEGVTGQHFYEKNAPSYTPAWVERFGVPRTDGSGEIKYVLCNDVATLVWATNLGDIEKHVLLACAPELDHPTQIVFDLDPGEPAGMIECARVALHLRGLFEAWGLQSFVKVSGSKGLHLSVPLNSGATYEQTQPFAKAVAELAVQQWRGQVVAEMAKSLRKGKVFIDWSQNSDFKTTVCVYSMRAKREQPFISMPVAWDELASAARRGKEDRLFFTPAQAVKRARKIGDLFAPVLELKQELPGAFTEALAAAPPPKLSAWPRNDQKSRDKTLREYTAKRHAARTPEPVAARAAERQGEPRRFIIQKHAASHLHYDWRLEMEGVLRSWAVPKGPPTKLKEARLAMRVEDHPMAYADFEGTIPPGNYGAGTVMVWDRGEYEDLTGHPTAAFYQGKMHLVMRGTKLRGEWILVKDRREERSDSGSEKWLLIKAGEAMPPFPPKVDDQSAITGRTMAKIASDNDAQWQSNRPAAEQPARKRPPRARTHSAGSAGVPPAGLGVPPKTRRATKARFIEPMKCLPVATMPESGEWTFEIKFDGYRCIAVKSGGDVTLFSRNERSLDDRFPEIREAVAALPGDLVLDGEIAALDDEGRPSFQLLQNNRSKAAATLFYVFDLLHRDGESLLAQPIERRRQLLEELLAGASDPLRLSPLLEAPAGQVIEAVRRLGLEGVVGKRAGSGYEPGERSGAWVKHRSNREQEFVIGGYIPGTHGFDSLLVGLYEGKRLLFVAKVKNGFVPRVRDEIFAEIQKLHQTGCPFANLPEKKGARRGDALTAENMKKCRWLKPRLVCQVAFVEWTDAGHLRHCTFVAMRDDKDPREVVRET